jgi:KUP system potassium uptake protein
VLWHKPKRWIALFAVVFLTIEVTFFAANLAKIVHGGWLPLVIAAIIFMVLVTWRKGRDRVSATRLREEGPLRQFVEHLDARDFPVVRVPGTAVFLHASAGTTPLALRANVEHNHVLHENVVILTIENERVPHVTGSDRLVPDDVGDPGDQITRITAHFGFQDNTDVPSTLRLANSLGMLEGSCDFDVASYFLSQITIVPSDAPGMSTWRKKLFLTLARNAASPVEYFRLPDNRTVTIGERIEL